MLAQEYKEGRVWKRSETGRYDRFKLVQEKLMITKSPSFASLKVLHDKLLRPLNEITWQ